MKQVVVVGGGISGLSAAYFLLKKSGRPPVQVSVLESGAYWGGKIRTERVDGFVIEAGPDCFLASKPQAAALCRELGLGESLQATIPQRGTYILHDGRLLPIPDGLAGMIPTRFGPLAASRLLSWPQKARLALDLALPPSPGSADESVGAFVSRRLGRGAYENLIQPLLAGIYSGDGDALSLAATFPALRDLEQAHGSLLKGARAQKRQPGTNGRSAFLTPNSGLAAMVEALVAWLAQHGAQLRLGARVAGLSTLDGDRYRIEIEDGAPLEADAVILATPASTGAALLAALDPQLAADLGAIRYASTATVSLAYRAADLPRPLDGYGYVIPVREGRPALACTWTSSKFAGRAPEGYALLRVFLGRAGQSLPATDEAGLLALARQELARTLGLQAEPLLARVFVWEQAMPQYNLGHPERVARIEAGMRQHPRLALAGNSYTGVGIPDCIRSGENAAEKISICFG